MDLKSKVVVISGGASGLGEACVKRFVKAGAKVAIIDRNEARCQALDTEMANPHQCISLPLDITDESATFQAFKTIESQWTTPQVIINCAGIAAAEKLISKEGALHSLESFQKVLKVNVFGTFQMSRIFVKFLVKNPTDRTSTENGVIINTASIAAFEGQLGQIAYSASKGAIHAMTLPLARELAQYGIRVNTIAPGIFETPMLATLDEKVRLALGQMVPFPPRLGNPDEFAALAQHICENGMINGETLRLDGALRMPPK